MLCTIEVLIGAVVRQHCEKCENIIKSERNDDGNRGILEIASSQPEDLGFEFCEDS